MSQKVLVPVDLSSNSKPIVAWATRLARDLHATLILLHVQEPLAGALGGEIYDPALICERPQLLKLLQTIHSDDPAIPVEHRLVLGYPAETIVRVAHEEQVSLIVMGSHGRTGLSRALLGSVAECVLRHASCPVMVFKGGSPSVPVFGR